MDDNENWTEKLLNFIEKDRFSLTTALIYVFIIAGVRSFLEAALGRYHGYGGPLFAQHVLLSFPELLMAVLVIYIITKRSPKKIMNVFLLGWWMLLIPPVADFLIYGEKGVELGWQYEYFSVHEILPALLNSWNPIYIYNLASRGQGLMFLGLMIGTAVYIALITRLHHRILELFKNRTFKKNIIRKVSQAVGGYFGIYLVVWFIMSFKFIIRMEDKYYMILNRFKVPYYSKYYTFFKEYNYPEELIFPTNESIVGLPTNLITNQSRLVYSSFFVLLTILTSFIILYLYRREKLISMLKDLPKTSMVLASLSAFLGITSIHMMDPDFSKGLAIDPTYFLHMPYILFSLLIITLLLSFSNFVYHLSDHWGDEEKNIGDTFLENHFSRYHFRHLSASFALAALFFSIIIGYIFFIITLVWIILSVFVFSIGKKIFRDNLSLPSFGIMSFLYGFYTPNAWHSFIVDRTGEVEVTAEVVYRYPPITLNIFLIPLWIAVTFWFLSRFKTFDEEEKKKLFIFNKIKSQYIVQATTFVLLLFPIMYFPSIPGLLIFIGPAVATSLWYKMLENHQFLFMGFIIQLFLFTISFLHFY